MIFPDVKSMEGFVFTHHVSGIEMKTNECSVSGLLTDELITIAETQYQAKVIFYANG